MEVFFEAYRDRIIGITGTKGKSTTTTLLYHILKKSGLDTVLSGNIGIPAFDILEEIHPDTQLVCELSCHQLEYIHVSPHIGVLLNIHEEHLDHYGTMEKYIHAKQQIYLHQLPQDLLFCGMDVTPADGTCRSRIFTVSDQNFDADVLLGGDTVNALAAQKGIPAQFIDSTEESIRSAIGVAKKMILTAEAEKNFTAQFETVLDNSYNGILEIDENKEIMIVNRAGEELFHKKASQLEGTALEKVIPELEQRYIDDVLSGKRDSFMTSVYVAGVPMMLTAAPIQYENKIRGAIISLYRNASVRKNDADELHSYYLKGYVAYAHFSDIRITGKEMEYCVELSKMYALSKNPVLICGEDGTDKEKLAQCIHNNSSYKAGPFVAVNCSGMTEQMQVDRLFGNPDAEDESMKKGALAIGDHGTIVISEIEKLSLLCQYRLYRAIRYDSLIQNDLERSQTLDNRIIAVTGADLYQYVEQGRFRQDLYYLLNSLTVEIPPLRKRPQDIRAIVEDCRVRFTKRYARFPKIAEDAMEALAGFGWQGNEIQLESFCERLFLTSPKKTITSDYVYFLLDTLYPVKERISEDGTTVIYQHPEAARLTELLVKHQGNRSAVAKELGISTTTLWRRMKKYGVINKYDLT